uniref:RRM domain-containing protein n=1 Tax=Ditylenchus dipsaci TaxID=166011 RepID=A0A915DQC2_9BILA
MASEKSADINSGQSSKEKLADISGGQSPSEKSVDISGLQSSSNQISPSHENVVHIEDPKEQIDLLQKSEHSQEKPDQRKVLDERLGFAVTLVEYFGSEGTAQASESLKKALGLEESLFAPWHENQQPQRPLPSAPPYFIYVSNISYNASKSQIKDYFGGDKNVKDIYMYKYGNGNFAGDCFLELVNCRKALDHVISLDHRQFISRQLTVSAICDEKSRRFSLNAMAENYKSRFIPQTKMQRPMGDRRSSLSYRSSQGSPRRSPFTKSPGSPRRSSFSNSQDVRRMPPRLSNANTNRSLYSTPPVANRQFSRFYSNNRGHHRPIDIPSPSPGIWIQTQNFLKICCYL